MKTRPILFSGPMVRAILDSSKTQTRRIAKLTDAAHVKEPRKHRRWHPGDPEARLACPYGQPGDHLWVRETWAAPHQYDGHKPVHIPASAQWNYAATEERGGLLWRPSIHMPRVASRLTLEITRVRVERLQDISEADAIAEGVERVPVAWTAWYRYGLPGDAPGLVECGMAGKIVTAFPKLAYQALWRSINGPGSWDTNPWIWAVDFKRVQP